MSLPRPRLSAPRLRLFALRLFLFALLVAAAPAAGFAQAGNFEMVKLAEGVYAALRTEPPGLTVNGNSVFIINEEDVVVVDATLTPGTAREEIAALRKLTTKPVRYVVNTHWHDDHVLGNVAYREAFPGVEFVAHAATREYLPATGLTNRKMAMSEGGYPGFIAALKRRLERNESVFGGPLDEEERTVLASDIRIAERYVAEDPSAEVVLPTVTLRERLTLHRGSRVIDILHLGRGHTSGDIVVHLPNEGIVVAGDLVIHPSLTSATRSRTPATGARRSAASSRSSTPWSSPATAPSCATTPTSRRWRASSRPSRRRSPRPPRAARRSNRRARTSGSKSSASSSPATRACAGRSSTTTSSARAWRRPTPTRLRRSKPAAHAKSLLTRAPAGC